MKNILPILIALVLAAFASFGIMQWSQNQQTQSQFITYMAPRELLAPGRTIANDDLIESSIPVPILSPQNGAVWTAIREDFVDRDNRGMLIGRTVTKEIKPGNPILKSALNPVTREFQGVDWRTKIEEGRRAITIPVGGINAVNGLVVVGDHVDVLVTLDVPSKDDTPQQTMNVPMRMGDAMQSFQVPVGGGRINMEPMTFYLLQDVEILAIGEKTFADEEIDQSDPLAALAAKAGRGGSGMTVALNPEQILNLAFVNAGGKATFTLALRAPGDVSLYDTTNKPPASYDQLLIMINAPR